MKKPITVAFWCGVLSIIMNALLIIFSFPFYFSEYSEPAIYFILAISLFGGVLGIFYKYGFVVVGKKFNNRLLYVMSWIGVGVGVVLLLFGILIDYILFFSNVAAQEIENTLSSETALAVLFVFLMMWALIAIIYGAYSVLFGIGLLKLRGKARYAEVAGILNIVAGATYIIFIGFFIKYAAFVFELMFMYKVAKKLER